LVAARQNLRGGATGAETQAGGCLPLGAERGGAAGVDVIRDFEVGLKSVGLVEADGYLLADVDQDVKAGVEGIPSVWDFSESRGLVSLAFHELSGTITMPESPSMHHRTVRGWAFAVMRRSTKRALLRSLGSIPPEPGMFATPPEPGMIAELLFGWSGKRWR
jgi:hypothetical protein